MIIGAIGVLIPYSMLTAIFHYPDILREDTAVILHKFHEGGAKLIWTWFAFAIAGLPLLPAYSLLGKQFETRSSLARVATTIGIAGLIVQMIGLLRWVFVVPVLANTFETATDEATRSAAIVAFKAVHQFGGVLLGEHLGQLFTITWTIMMCIVFARTKTLPLWINIIGIVGAIIYLTAQAELFSTVMPDLPTWKPAGFIGSTVWLVWLVVVGVGLIRKG